MSFNLLISFFFFCLFFFSNFFWWGYVWILCRHRNELLSFFILILFCSVFIENSSIPYHRSVTFMIIFVCLIWPFADYPFIYCKSFCCIRFEIGFFSPFLFLQLSFRNNAKRTQYRIYNFLIVFSVKRMNKILTFSNLNALVSILLSGEFS